jgi:hypothetical protein
MWRCAVERTDAGTGGGSSRAKTVNVCNSIPSVGIDIERGV